MAKNKVEIDVRADDKGTMKKMSLESKKAGDNLDKVGRSAGTADRNIKGTAQASSNATKNFSKMSQGMGGLVAAYATLAANIFAITAAFSFFQRAADLRVLEQGQLAYAQKTGKSLSLLTSQVQAATGGLLKFEEAAQAVSIGTAAGLSTGQLTGLATVAKNASMALGRDLTDSFNRLTRGAIKAEPELLDELGIIIRLDKATKDYADSINKSAKDLTTFEKSQAVVNAVITQGEKKFGDLGGAVNEITRLGKTFNDVIRRIQETLTPVAEFIAGALSNNIYALAGAFAYLGTGIAKSFAGAAPALEDISGAANEARDSLKQAAGSSVIGKKLAEDPSSLSAAELKRVEASTKAKSSTIINYDNITRQAVSRNLKILQAEQQLYFAQGQTGVKRFYAMWKAELALLQATHGRVLGTMKAGVQAFARGANAILGAAGIIGILFTIIGLMKQVIEYFQSDELKSFLKNSRALGDILKEQNITVSDLTKKLGEAANESDRIAQAANLISNISFKGVEGFRLGTREDFESTGEAAAALDSAKTTVDGIIGSLQAQIGAFEKVGNGEQAEGLRKKLQEILTISNELKGFNPAKINSQTEVYNTLVGRLNSSLQGLNKTNEEAIKPLTDQSTALKSVTIAGEEFTNLQTKLKEAPSKFSEFVKIAQDLESSLKKSGLAQRTLADLKDEELAAIEKVLGTQEKSVKIQTIIDKLAEKRVKILETEQKIELAKLELQRKYFVLNKGATPLIAARLKLQQEQANIEAEINSITANRDLLELARLARSDTEAKKDLERLNLLREQRDAIIEQQQEMYRLGQAAKVAFESGLQTNISALIKGEQSSLKEAILNLTKGILDSVADTLSKIITEKIMGSVFKQEDPAVKMKNAFIEGGEIAATKIRSAIAGDTVPGDTGASAGTSTASPSSQSKGQGFWSKLLGQKSSSETTFGVSINEKTGLPMQGTITKTTRGTGIAGLFDNFINGISEVLSGDAPFLDGLKGIFGGLLNDMGGIFGTLFEGLGGLFGGSGGGLSSMLGLFTGFFGFMNGGYAKGGFRAFADGGMVTRPTLGLVGEGKMNEAIVPLPNGRAIPVDMKGAGQNNNVVVNVSVDNQGNGQTTMESQSGADAGNLGQAIARAVQQELQNQKRSGGILNPYGVS